MFKSHISKPLLFKILQELRESFGDEGVEATLEVVRNNLRGREFDIGNYIKKETTFESINVLQEYGYECKSEEHRLKMQEIGLLLLETMADDIIVLKQHQPQFDFTIYTFLLNKILAQLSKSKCLFISLKF